MFRDTRTRARKPGGEPVHLGQVERLTPRQAQRVEIQPRAAGFRAETLPEFPVGDDQPRRISQPELRGDDGVGE